MSIPPPDWLWDNFRLLARFQFMGDDFNELGARWIKFVSWREATDLRGPLIAIPMDPPVTGKLIIPQRIPFSGTHLTMWNPVPPPASDWKPYPGDGASLWWRHHSGTLMPAWALWPNLVELLSGKEDRSIDIRDEHGRLPLHETLRFKAGVYAVPAVNEALAVLLDALYALRSGKLPALALPDGRAKLTVLLSHDCDILGGHDWLTQAVRLFRAGRAMTSGNLAEAGRRLRAIAQNATSPGRFYLENLLDMIALESRYGFRSICYILNGNNGRFGARDHPRWIKKLAESLPPGWELGLHYNYDTFENAETFAAQQAQLTALTGRTAIAGRAHYLRFNFLTSPRFLQAQGIQLDESSGWVSKLSFRNGIAGPFRPFDSATRRGLSLIEVPLLIADNSLRLDGQFRTAQRIITHLSRIGGMITVLFHPGAADNPEEPSSTGAYAQLIELTHAMGAESLTPSQILERAGTSSFGQRMTDLEGIN